MTHPHAHKINTSHLSRTAVVYVRQSSERQVQQNLESQRLQYALVDRARALGWAQVEVVDCDLGVSAGPGSVRAGFDRLLASVALRQVGIIFSREASRLSRTDRDWCQLLEVCGLFNTLIGDADQIYDVNLMDDQLVLGIKGTLSVVELKILKMRLLQGLEEKARRGELRRRLTPGYAYDADGRVVKDPDLRVQEAVALIFRRFRETGSVHRTFRWFHNERILLPVNGTGSGKRALQWKLPTLGCLAWILRNPTYAGAYVYGHRQLEVFFEGGRLRKRTGRRRAPQDCRVLIRNHHEGYIDWETFEENQEMIRRNSTNADWYESKGAVRSGSALLAGLIRCGRCGRKMQVRYSGKEGRTVRYQCGGDATVGGERCWGFPGGKVDEKFCVELMRVLSPLGLAASLEAVEKLSEAGRDKRNVLIRQLQQAEYEVRRAFEQYNEVDPRNRLVAAELERRWNERLESAERVRDELERLDAETRSLTEAEREKAMVLGSDFSLVWNDGKCPVELKKKIIRTVVEEVVVRMEGSGGQHLCLVIHWKGGCHTQFVLPRRPPEQGQRTGTEALDLIRVLARRYGDDVIARVLNKHGCRTGKDKRWTTERVQSARRNHKIPGQTSTLNDPNVLTLGEAARHCGVSTATIRNLVAGGLLKRTQAVRWAPWEIRRDDLDSRQVQKALNRLRLTGKLEPKEVCSDSQLTLFPTTKPI